MVFDMEWSFWAWRVYVYELNSLTREWGRVRDLGGRRALFVGANYPFCVDVPDDGSADSHPKANCVYVADMFKCHASSFNLMEGGEDGYNWDADFSYPAIREVMQMPIWF